jgi:hypothetical protein
MPHSNATTRQKPSRFPLNLLLGTLIAVSVCVMISARAQAQASATAESPDADRAATLARVTALRQAFIERIHAAGLTCPIAPPKIVMDDVPSFGNYDDETNVLRTSDWSKLTPEESGVFFQLAGPGADATAAREMFEGAAHRWIFIHELGHWWQACTGAFKKSPPWEIEYDADRIALAYWREVDPALATKMMAIFQGVIDHSPNPVPPGQEIKKYFNEHYQQLGPTPAYRWYQSRMVVTAIQETPTPTFAQTLAVPKR